MKRIAENELHLRIHSFLARKMAEHPELREDGRVISKLRPNPLKGSHHVSLS